jgi:hypothetical protein
VNSVNAYKASQRELDIWVGENHFTPQGNYLAINLNACIILSSSFGLVLTIRSGN